MINFENIFISPLTMSFSSQSLSLKYHRLDDRKNEEKRPKVYKRQQIYWNENEKKRPKVYKHQQINENEDEEKQDQTNYDSDKYIPLSSPLKVSNCLSNLGERTRCLLHFISIQSKKD